MANNITPKLRTIGWKEIVDLPDLGIYDVPAKVDTGARTSVLHCSHIRLVKKGRKQYVEFRPLDDRFGKQTDIYVFPFHSERKVKNSFGQEENRYVISTTLSLFNVSHDIELSLRDRSGMEFPVLLGRSFIRKKFLVDVSRANLSKKKTER
ncbi:ATP-dependent zinc protease family protein [Parapedobacter tibetensis]|uniref:ATP-dependent zinc protease family protein n=1 Tax=Parapedobacter tibetensis TaxID=2972951 RepID=UPI00214DA20A|nr:RimK/LysX family protein [Parapedobacter tibetensis]